MGWRTVRCPVVPREQQWIEHSLDWFAEQFGTEQLRAPIVQPAAELFPDAYTGSEHDMRDTALRLCDRMGVPRERITLEFYDDDDPIGRSTGSWQRQSAAG